MVQISKHKLKPEVHESISHIFIDIFRDQSLTSNLDELFNVLFSHSERIMVAKRIAILYLLQKKVTHRDISQILKVSVSTIHKFIRIADDNQLAVERILHSALTRDKLDMFFEDILANMHGVGQIGTNWSATLHRQQKHERKKRFGI